MTKQDMLKRYVDAGRTDKILAEIIFDLIKEIGVLSETRKISTDRALASVIRELDDKFQAFAKLAGDCNPNAFKIILQKEIPDTKLLYP